MFFLLHPSETRPHEFQDGQKGGDQFIAGPAFRKKVVEADPFFFHQVRLDLHHFLLDGNGLFKDLMLGRPFFFGKDVLERDHEVEKIRAESVHSDILGIDLPKVIIRDLAS